MTISNWPARVFIQDLIVGTGKYRDFEETRAAVEASGAEIVTVAVRPVNIADRKSENLLDYIDPKRYQILPNTAGCYTVEEAVRTCHLAREVGVGDMVELEVIGDQKTLFPTSRRRLRPRKFWSRKASRCCPTSPTTRWRVCGWPRSDARR